MEKGRATGHVSLAERKRGPVWYAKYRTPAGRQVQKKLGPAWTGRTRPTAGHLTRKQAEDALRAILVDLSRGEGEEIPNDTGPTFQDAVDAWLRYVEHDAGVAISTLGDYRRMARMILTEFGADTPLRLIDETRIAEYRRSLVYAAGRAKRTQQKYMIAVGSIFENARGREKWIETNPAADVEPIRLPRRSGDFNALSIEEVFAVAEATGNDRDRTLILTAAFTGLRMGELRALRWEDVRFTEDLILVRRNLPHGNRNDEITMPKSGKTRSVPLMEQAAVPLAKLSMRENFTGPQDFVFCTEAGTPLDDSPVRKMFYDALVEAGLGHLRDRDRGEPIVFHDLRHTFGTIGAGIWPLHDLQGYMGHADIQTTMIYVHHTPKTTAAAELSAAVAKVMGQEANHVPNHVPNQAKLGELGTP